VYSDIAQSKWSKEGLETVSSSYDEERGVYDVICESTHLTSFAVLLDVNDALSVSSDDLP